MTSEIMLRVMFLLFLAISGIVPAMAEEDMTSELICPCECVMVISTCDCPTAIRIKKDISMMKEHGFSETQIFSALQAEYGKDILAHREKIYPMSLWLAGASLIILSVFLGYIFTRRTKTAIIPDIKRYEDQFEEEYAKFVSEMEGK